MKTHVMSHNLRDPIEAFVARQHSTEEAWPVPLIGLELSVTIHGGLAVVEATRTYTNRESRPIEALLTLPVPVHAAFFGLTAKIGGVLHRGKAHSKRSARGRYEEAIQEGKAAVLHEELLRGVHSLSLGNLGPGDSAEVTMRWAEVLRCDGTLGRLRIPMTVGDVYGCSGLEDADELVHGGETLMASLRVSHDARDVRIEAPPHGFSSATDSPRKAPDENGAFAATVPTHTPLDLVVDGWRPGEVTGKSWDDRPIVLKIQPTIDRDKPLDMAVLLDRSGSMAERCEGSGNAAVTKHQVAVQGIDDLVRLLRAGDRIALWQFDTTCEPVGPERPGPVKDVPMLVDRFGEPRGGTEIGEALDLCMTRAGVRDILLVTDGKSYAMDPHALARKGRRVFVVLIGEDSLEANVGHLAALTGGDLRFAVGADARQAMAGILAGLRTNAESPTAGNVRIRVYGPTAAAKDDRTAAETRSVLENAVGAYAAHLALATMDADQAAELAEREGLVTHLTSLCIVDEEGTRQEGIPAMRKVALASPRTFALMPGSDRIQAAGYTAPSMHRPSGRVSDGFVAGSVLPRTDDSPPLHMEDSRTPDPGESRAILPRLRAMFRSKPAPTQRDDIDRLLEQLVAELSASDSSGVLVAVARRMPWATHARALARGSLSGMPDHIAAALLGLSGKEQVQVFADRVGIQPIAAAIAVMAYLAKPEARHAARVLRSIVAAGGADLDIPPGSRLERPGPRG